MYHSITIGNKNTWDNWHLIPSSRPLVNPPTLKKKTIDVPGADGMIDLTTAITGYPTYENREGSWEFYVMNGYQEWFQLYSEIMAYLHGKAMRCYLEDEPDFYYEGRFTVNEWRSEKDYSKIVIDYSLKPYKYWISTSVEPWKWDPFSFVDGVIQPVLFADIPINSASYVTKSYNLVDVDRAPISPTLLVSGNITVKWTDHRGIVYEQVLEQGSNLIPEMVFYNQAITLYFKGTGTVSIVFRSGRL